MADVGEWIAIGSRSHKIASHFTTIAFRIWPYKEENHHLMTVCGRHLSTVVPEKLKEFSKHAERCRRCE